MLANLLKASNQVNPRLTYINTYGGTGTTTQTATVSYGTEESTRYIIACVSGVFGTNGTLNSFTIGGVSATAISGNEGVTTGEYNAIYALSVPTGASGTVAATFSTAPQTFRVSIYTLVQASSITPVAQDFQMTTVTSRTVTVNTATGGCVLALVSTGSAPTGVTLTGVTTDDVILDSASIHAVGSLNDIMTANITVTANPGTSTLLGTNIVSWR